MHRSYNDILSRIPEPPRWWQQGGIPRFEVFDPASSTGVYTTEVALAEIACQMTGVRFLVTLEGGNDRSIAKAIRDFSLCYGDPPNTPDVSGHTTSDMLKVVEYWCRAHEEYVVDGRIIDWKSYDEWRRDPSLEVAFPNGYPDASKPPNTPTPQSARQQSRMHIKTLFKILIWGFVLLLIGVAIGKATSV